MGKLLFLRLLQPVFLPKIHVATDQNFIVVALRTRPLALSLKNTTTLFKIAI